MSVPAQSARQRKLASVAAASMANRDTPLIRNAWYVAARPNNAAQPSRLKSSIRVSSWPATSDWSCRRT